MTNRPVGAVDNRSEISFFRLVLRNTSSTAPLGRAAFGAGTWGWNPRLSP